jgi:hypothetical protein
VGKGPFSRLRGGWTGRVSHGKQPVSGEETLVFQDGRFLRQAGNLLWLKQRVIHDPQRCFMFEDGTGLQVQPLQMMMKKNDLPHV